MLRPLVPNLIVTSVKSVKSDSTHSFSNQKGVLKSLQARRGEAKGSPGDEPQDPEASEKMVGNNPSTSIWLPTHFAKNI